MAAENNSKDSINRSRLLFSISYFVVALLLTFIFWKDMFYFQVESNTWNIYRFVWCCIAVFLGFAIIAFAFRYIKKSPLPEYLTFYPFQLLAMATLVFGGLHIFDATSGYLFYYLSFGFCFTLGYLVDSYWSFVKTVIGRSTKW